MIMIIMTITNLADWWSAKSEMWPSRLASWDVRGTVPSPSSFWSKCAWRSKSQSPSQGNTKLATTKKYGRKKVIKKMSIYIYVYKILYKYPVGDICILHPHKYTSLLHHFSIRSWPPSREVGWCLWCEEPLMEWKGSRTAFRWSFFLDSFQESYGWNSPWDFFSKVIHLWNDLFRQCKWRHQMGHWSSDSSGMFVSPIDFFKSCTDWSLKKWPHQNSFNQWRVARSL